MWSVSRTSGSTVSEGHTHEKFVRNGIHLQYTWPVGGHGRCVERVCAV